MPPPPTVVELTRRVTWQTITRVQVYEEDHHVAILGRSADGGVYSPLNFHIHKDDLPALIRALERTLVGPLGALALDAESGVCHADIQ